MIWFKLLWLFPFVLLPTPAPASYVDAVKVWARTLGEELWTLNEALTKTDQIRIKYKQMNASVKEKDGEKILESALQSVSTMLTRKINAVKCIHATAQELANNFNYTVGSEFEYCSAKYSKFYNENTDMTANVLDEDKIPPFVQKYNETYTDMIVENDSHFYNIGVNTDTSCVHVPTNIYDREKEAQNAILWSKGLNDIFIKNYQSDPSLVWQYFGSSRGILRFYPGMPWTTMITDTYDCRVKSWYIEAATCSKDVIILFDVSGSMTGFKNYVARRTLKSLLDTLSNNDNVNVYTFKNETREVVTCFQNLVQATRENLETIMQTLEPLENGKHRVLLDGYANLTIAYTKAFTTLKQRRSKCDITSTQGCNQLVMVITDYVPGNLSEVFEEHNRHYVNNKTYIPVRVFTYLIGKEVTNVREIGEMACSNRGFFVHIHSVEEVQQQVLKYINVIARPMILEGEEPPPTWTHASIDATRTAEWGVSGDTHVPDEDKLVTSVAIPAFDYKYNRENSADAILLGVAGTDVPIDSIAKLAQPHQLGVNGYSFIISNNGYVILHPLLITTINKKLQTNYNSVDFVEVEQVDHPEFTEPRVLGEQITELREHLVNGDNGSLRDLKILYHYDKMRRIARVQHDYYFNKLEGTPFSMGISLPHPYGDTELLLKDNPLEAKQGQELTGINVTDYFRYSYRIHPDWVYCKYHYLEGHETPNPEVEIWNFLVNISKNEIDITKKQYEEEVISGDFTTATHCGNATTTLGNDAYYCNEDLVKQLVFDAKLTQPYFKVWDADEEVRKLADIYKVDVRFISTASGLTRWHYLQDDDKNEIVDEAGRRHKNFSGKVFGDKYFTAIEETWYKAAVLQHMINKESLVVATPLPILDDIIIDRPPIENEDGDITITSTYAIFYKDGDSETPASVVGMQFSYRNFFDRFMDLTGATNGKKESCGDDNYDCFIVDSSGYIVLSKDQKQVGQFFGVESPYVMKSLMDRDIFSYVIVFNYQALCPESQLNDPSRAWSFDTPFNVFGTLIKWLLAEFFFLISDFYKINTYAYSAVIEDKDYDYIDLMSKAHTDAPTTTEAPDTKNSTSADKEEDKTFSCDHQIYLYILNQTNHTDNGIEQVIYQEEPTACAPPYWAAYMPKTNLLLVVVERGHDFDESCEKPYSTTPQATKNSTISREPCHKLDLGMLPRRRLEGCFTFHDKERNITACGRGNINHAKWSLFAITTLLALLVTKLLIVS